MADSETLFGRGQFALVHEALKEGNPLKAIYLFERELLRSRQQGAKLVDEALALAAMGSALNANGLSRRASEFHDRAQKTLKLLVANHLTANPGKGDRSDKQIISSE